MISTEKINFERIAAIVICVAAAGFAVWALFHYALGIVFPFALGILLGAAAKKLASSFTRREGFLRKLIGAAIYLLLLFILCTGAFLAIERLIIELLKLAETLTADGGAALNEIGDYISNLTSRLPIISDLREKSADAELWARLDSALEAAVHSMLSEIAASIPRLATQLMGALPNMFLFVTVALVTGFFFSVGAVDLSAFSKLLPEHAANVLSELRRRAALALSSWFRAYLLIMGLTFIELFIGLSVLGVNYAFLLAVLIALVDILPVFGAGSVLLPWAAILFFLGDKALAIGLFVLWVIISVVRDFAEPRIVGKTLGISPVLTLFSMYAGARFFGIAGMISAPLILMLAKSFLLPKAE